MKTETEQLIHAALRLAVWAAGEGLCPADGEPAESPDDFLFRYSQATDAEDWDALPDQIIAELRADAKATPALEDILRCRWCDELHSGGPENCNKPEARVSHSQSPPEDFACLDCDKQIASYGRCYDCCEKNH